MKAFTLSVENLSIFIMGEGLITFFRSRSDRIERGYGQQDWDVYVSRIGTPSSDSVLCGIARIERKPENR